MGGGARVALAVAAALAAAPAGHALGEESSHAMEGGVVLEVSAPDSVAAGSEFPVSVLIRNGGWEDKDSVYVEFGRGGALAPAGEGGVGAGRMAPGSSYGEAVTFRADPAAPAGTHFVNLAYTHVLLEGGEDPRAPFRADVAVPVVVRERAGVMVSASVPESVFAGAEFPVTARVSPGDSGISGVTVEIVPPEGVGMLGQAAHSFSRVPAGGVAEAPARLVVEAGDVAAERRLPVQVAVRYTDASGTESLDTRTVELLLRPRAFMELGADGGVWIGGVFLAPYVSIGTIVGIPAGALLTLLARRRSRAAGGRGA